MSGRILDCLLEMQDIPYRDFQRRLIPNIDPEMLLGVRTPQLRALARELCGTREAEAFLAALPHAAFEENQLHAFIIERMKGFDECLEAVNGFLPFVDNWATCDQLSPRALARDLPRLLDQVRIWLASGETYTVRFGVNMLMRWYLDEAFDPAYLEMVAALHSQEYYVNMVAAWYFATALAKHYEQTLPFIERRPLDPWTHNKAIQKAIESRRITDAQKAYLRTLKIR